MIFNIYNKKNQVEEQKYTTKRKLIILNIFKKTIICKDFNVHYSWLNSKIENSIRANALIAWLNRFN